MNDPGSTHREIVAAVASLKSCLRSVILAVQSAQPASKAPAPGSSDWSSKTAAAVQRGADAAASLDRLLAAVADQTLGFPLETSKRLVDVGLPELLTQLLAACQAQASWPAPAATACAPADGDDAAEAVLQLPGLQHPSWEPVQQLVRAVFVTLARLTAVLVRACSRSTDPAMVLTQLASAGVMKAQVVHMQQLLQAAEGGALVPTAMHNAPACVAAFSSGYSLLAAAVDAQPGLDALKQQLTASLCATSFLPVAAQLLMHASSATQQQQQCAAATDYQNAGWSLLTIALLLSGGDIAVCPTLPSSQAARPGQPTPSSILAARIRLEAAAGPQGQQQLSAAAGSAQAADTASGLQYLAMQQQLMCEPMLAFLQERLWHCVAELRGSSSSSQKRQQPDKQSLLPGRCCPQGEDVLSAALRVLRCWRPLLLAPDAATLPIATSGGVTVLLTLLSGALSEPIRAGSSEREALRGRVIRVAVHCLALVAGCLEDGVLVAQLPALTAVLAGVVSAAGCYWDANKRAVKSQALPYTGQVRCLDKATGDMMVRYAMASAAALDLLRQLLLTCSQHTAAEAGPAPHASVMVGAGLLPALEQLFRQLPVVSPAHVAAAHLLVEVLPACSAAPLSCGQLPLLATLRKFVIKSVGVPDPDREAGVTVVTQLVVLLGLLAANYQADAPPASAEECPAAVLMQHAAVQLLPALQVYVSALLKGPLPAPISLPSSSAALRPLAALEAASGAAAGRTAHILPALLTTYQQLAALARAAPELQLTLMLLAGHALGTATEVLGSSYWALPQFSAGSTAAVAAGQTSPSGGDLLRGSSGGGAPRPSSSSSVAASGQHAVQCVVQMAEDLLAASSAAAERSASGGGSAPPSTMRASCSADCLCSLRRGDSGEACCTVGNPKCGLDGICCCGSPKACSDITSPAAGDSEAGTCGDLLSAAGTASGGGAAAGVPAAAAAAAQQLQEAAPHCLQQLLVTASLLQSKLLPEALRSLQALPRAECEGLGPSLVSPRLTEAAGGSEALLNGGGLSSNSMSRPGSTVALAVAVPARNSKAAVGRAVGAGAVVASGSPHGASPLGTSPPSLLLRGSLGRAAGGSGSQAYLTGYKAEPPPQQAQHGFNGSSGHLSALRMPGTAATAASRLTSSHAAGGGLAVGASPRAVDDGAYGLLRAGSWCSWAGSGSAATGLLQEAMAGSARQSSSGFGSSPSLASLASPTMASCSDGPSPFFSQQLPQQLRGDSGTSASRISSSNGLAAAAPPSASVCRLQRRLEAAMLATGRSILRLAAAGLVGNDATLVQRRSSSLSLAASPTAAAAAVATGGSSDGSGSGAGGVLSGTSSLPKPAFVGAGYSSSYQLHILGPSPRTSFSGSGQLGALGSDEDVLASLRSCLVAAGAAAATGEVMLSGLNSAKAQPPLPSPPAAPTGSLGGEAGGSAADVMFPVELGLSQLAISPSAAAAAAALAAAAGSEEGQAACLKPELLRRLLAALLAAAPLLSRHSSLLEAELCGQLLLARLRPTPTGCWNGLCVNMPGASESSAPGKPCTSCKVAVFCSKGCERAAWPEHTLACSRLAGLGAAASGGRH